MVYKITVKTLKNAILQFTVDSYEISKGDFVSFKDRKTKKPKKFHASQCEIDEVGPNGS